ncbi:hypothetical protein BABINDRAFT_161814 [Babjeviella inositovora NRRL Y-12698]|uniref:Uncharacterized protein n=1 Tax=Babjeviella inositovora NRRL Y-12698 TaxID=984486 RepID=A0A1E3QQR3_9ASCO|nr:uncharacterized protein BABINDRAFT_161814 [Babjeviella inositovora NRRL Y-12698]ODQ79412.1 hypothetical protein BABINDRAFT_161814 [Babjeviella inositovora NRRL Y-12698]
MDKENEILDGSPRRLLTPKKQTCNTTTPLPQDSFTPHRPRSLQRAYKRMGQDLYNTPDADSNFDILKEDYGKLERLYADQLIKNSRIIQDQEKLEFELLEKDQTLLALASKFSELAKLNKKLSETLAHEKDNMLKEGNRAREVQMMLEAKISSLQRIVKENENIIEQLSGPVPPLDQFAAMEKEYTKLQRLHKVSETNYEYEMNAKSILIGQIETLGAENARLLRAFSELQEKYEELNEQCLHSIVNIDDIEDSDLDGDFRRDFREGIQDKVRGNILGGLDYDLPDGSSYPNVQRRCSDDSLVKDNSFTDSSDSGSETFRFTSLADELSSISRKANVSVETIDEQNEDDLLEALANLGSPGLNQNRFMFPSPKKSSQSPRILSASTPHHTKIVPLEIDCNLRSMKLNTSSNASPSKSSPETFFSHQKRHSRTMSTDIIPIQVEFEPSPFQRNSSNESVRMSPAMSQRSHASSVASRAALDRLPHSGSHSRVSSHGETNPPLDEARQEITKLKFELQSVKLQNEKLMSFIGFELQKMDPGSVTFTDAKWAKGTALPRLGQIEYSDAKLIHSSKQVLRNKRILRSVSVIQNVQRRRSLQGLRAKKSVSIIDAEGNHMDVSSLANSSFEDQSESPSEEESLPRTKLINSDELLAPISALRVTKRRPLRGNKPRCSSVGDYRRLNGIDYGQSPLAVLLRGIDISRVFLDFDLDVE